MLMTRLCIAMLFGAVFVGHYVWDRIPFSDGYETVESIDDGGEDTDEDGQEQA